MTKLDMNRLFSQDWDKRLKMMHYDIIDEAAFVDIERDNPWFSAEKMMPFTKEKGGNMSYEEVFQFVFGYIFGSFGYTQNLDEAERLIFETLKNNPEPTCYEDWEIWHYVYSHFQIQLGVVYALKKQYIKAVYHFMLGIKTGKVSLSKTYIGFINYVVAKLDAMPTEKLDYSGCGFSAECPMGCCEQSAKAVLMPHIAVEVIPAMEGNDGEVVAVFTYSDVLEQRKQIGRFNRIGSTSNDSQIHIIDIYETYVISKDYKLYDAIFYFDGYVYQRFNTSIKIANGFHICRGNKVSEMYRIIENK